MKARSIFVLGCWAAVLTAVVVSAQCGIAWGGTLPVTSGLQFWVDAADGSTITTSGTTVTAWKNKAGTGQTGTSGGTPTLVSGASDTGLPMVSFNHLIGTDVNKDYFNFGINGGVDPDPNLQITENITIISALRFNTDYSRGAAASATGLLFTAHSGTPNGYYAMWWYDQTSATYRDVMQNCLGGAGVSATLSPALPTYPSMALHEFYGSETAPVYSSGGTSYYTESVLNGTINPGQTTPVSSTWGVGTRPFALGGNLPGYGDYSFGNLIGEMLIYNRVLSDSERAQVYSYLNKKWVVPEPSTLVMLLGAGMGLVAYAWRRRRS